MKWTPADPAYQKVPELVGGVDHDPPLGVPWTGLEDWEDGSLSGYGGDTGNFAVDQTSPVKEGSYSLKGTNDSDGTNSRISDTGISTSQGDIIRARVRAVTNNSGVYVGFYFFTQNEASPPDGYRVYLNYNGFLDLGKVDGGSFSTLNRASMTVSAGNWYRLQAATETDGTITATAYDASGSQLAQTSATDTTHSSGGIGWHYSNDKTAFDDMEVQ